MTSDEILDVKLKAKEEKRQLFAELIEEWIHTSLKNCNSKEANTVRKAIFKMPNGEWKTVCYIVADVLVDTEN